MGRPFLLLGIALLLAAGCGGEDVGETADGAESSDAGDGGADDGHPEPEAAADADADADADDDGDAGEADDGGPDVPPTCGFDYESVFVYESSSFDLPWSPPHGVAEGDGIDRVVHAEPPPPGTWQMRVDGEKHDPPPEVTMPAYDDTMPLFARAPEWDQERRCYETPLGVQLLTQPEAYDLYRRIAEATTGVAVDDAPGRRWVVGLRGAYPGTFAWHGNRPNRFNDTLVLLWRGSDGAPNVREFPVNTDVGARDFGDNSSSSLRPNRRYDYVVGWHRTYNALHIDEDGYRVRDDTNHNGHWDSDRNGWLPPLGPEDHDRTGGGHNIHMGSLDAPLGTAAVDVWSAGCQVIPGMANWTEFIGHAWTREGEPVDYFLIDVRDIAPEVWRPCTPDGTHACPFRIASFPFSATGDTTTVATSDFDVYNCSTADESGPEIVWVFTIDRSGTLSVSVDCTEPVDIDVHLLDGDDPNACLARGHWSFEYAVTPGRYFVVADTWSDGTTARAGPLALLVDLR